MMRLFALGLFGSATLTAQVLPPPGQLGSEPYSIRKTWVIGGEGPWDYLTVDPEARQLFISHGAVVQVVDVETGAVAGQVTGLHDAHQVALAEGGDVGFVSDGPADRVAVFDRRSFKVVADIPTVAGPRSLVYEPRNRLLFAVSSPPRAEPVTPPRRQPQAQHAFNPATRSAITVIDADGRAALGTLLLPGRLGIAATGGDGMVYVNVVDRDQIARLDAGAILSALKDERGRATTSMSESATEVGGGSPARPRDFGVTLDLTSAHTGAASGSPVTLFALGGDCHDPRGLAVDGQHQQLFAACGNMKMSVVNAVTGAAVTSLPIGPGAEAIAYDPSRGMIYTANGGAAGSLTVIRQDVTDTYAVIQTLSTQQQARTLAVNQSTGEVYLVTELIGLVLPTSSSISVLKAAPAKGSFQVLVVGTSSTP